ncbi:mitochondrial outer membrane protein porin 2-like, partial [Lactuca sativa]|uniref:mitochondrial outer membrane protein porin 2-like n=1 Tax=Lactuca sativa TaxID=4236 RepID=UPI000CD96C9C
NSTATKKGGLSSGDVGVIHKYNNTLIDVKFDTQPNIDTTLTIMEFVPLTKTIASFKIPNFTSGKVQLLHSLSYFHYHAPLTSAVALTQAPNIDLSATTSTPTFSIGVEPCYEISYCKLTKYTVDITVNKPYSSASLGDKGNTIRESYIHHFDASKKNVVVWEITITFLTNENDLQLLIPEYNDQWADRMQDYLNGLDEELWSCITGNSTPPPNVQAIGSSSGNSSVTDQSYRLK